MLHSAAWQSVDAPLHFHFTHHQTNLKKFHLKKHIRILLIRDICTILGEMDRKYDTPTHLEEGDPVCQKYVFHIYVGDLCSGKNSQCPTNMSLPGMVHAGGRHEGMCAVSGHFCIRTTF